MKALLISACVAMLVCAKGRTMDLFEEADSESLLEDDGKSATDKIVEINQAKDKDLFEGDIVVTDHDDVDQREQGDVDGPLAKKYTRNARRSRLTIWKTKVIPFEVVPELAGVSNIGAAIEEFNKHTCIRWVPRTTEANWVKIVKETGCWSLVGKSYWSAGFQQLSLGDGCHNKGTIMHEMMHASGFWHEQSRPDRNNYVEVMWENIAEGKSHNFNKYDRGQIDDLNANYDFSSLMHYGSFSFSKNGKRTIQAVGDPTKGLGQRDGFSVNDIFELNALYDCKGPSGGWSNWGTFSPCSPACKKNRQRFCTAEDRETKCPGANVYGIGTEEIQCDNKECYAPVDGHWGRWSSWGACSKTCGYGQHTRTRLCDDPKPQNGGKACPGNSKQSQSCKQHTCGLGPDDCEFELGMCNWTQTVNGYQWIRKSFSTPSSNTGPSGDHSTGQGYYLYAEASNVAQGQKADLVSKAFLATSGRCVRFFYNMNGAAIGTLNVFVKDSVNGTETLIFTKSGNKGNSWIPGNGTITSSNKYKIVFQAIRGVNYRGDIAIDDVTFKEHACDIAVTQAPPTSQQPITEQPTTKQPTTELPTTKQPTTELPTTKQPTTELPTTQEPTTERPTPSGCSDTRKKCGAWARAGYCHRFQYVKDNCKKSCQVCDCSDTRKECGAWARAGYCHKSQYVKDKCKKSCQVCGLAACNDKKSWCPRYGQYCRYENIRRFCSKTCKVC
ncbi:zinc metalloproteinase nas-14 isoform X3 [Nematostella vectensis]|uniref:zinc metalloproteinase nas-14 isoform X3 n=1 Tax=Nematostella vectensis TaxID=45351 RepID=UPI0020776F0B|nr:zinc metalloproteinase nas-14 isoform X3 [Nematostella vectensis]